MNINWSVFEQMVFNDSGHNSSAAAGATSGENEIMGGLIAANLLNPATATAAGVNISPVTQGGVASDIDAILDPELLVDLL